VAFLPSLLPFVDGAGLPVVVVILGTGNATEIAKETENGNVSEMLVQGPSPTAVVTMTDRIGRGVTVTLAMLTAGEILVHLSAGIDLPHQFVRVGTRANLFPLLSGGHRIRHHPIMPLQLEVD
jgi:hypothetical protein